MIQLTTLGGQKVWLNPQHIHTISGTDCWSLANAWQPPEHARGMVNGEFYQETPEEIIAAIYCTGSAAIDEFNRALAIRDDVWSTEIEKCPSLAVEYISRLESVIGLRSRTQPDA